MLRVNVHLYVFYDSAPYTLDPFRPLLLGCTSNFIVPSPRRTLSPLCRINFPFLSPLETGGRVNAARLSGSAHTQNTHTHTHVLLRSEKREGLKNDTGLEAIVIIH